MDMKIGSTTGYNNEMMDILTCAAKKQGYVPDCVVCATDVPDGRPAPGWHSGMQRNSGFIL
jgi:phosphonoacetaldehyde hydrolase